MPHFVVDSPDDPRLEPYRNIRFRDPTEGGRRFIAEGKLVVERLLRSRHRCLSLLVESDHHGDIVAFAEGLEQPPDIFSADLSTLRTLVGFDFHRGILACGEHPQPLPLTDLAPIAAGQPPLLVICGVNNPENIGGLLRSAAAFGVTQVACTADVAHPFSRRALRVSMATALRFRFFQLVDPVAELTGLIQRSNYRVLATTLAPRSISLDELSLDERPLAIVVGSEGEGIPIDIQQVCTDLVTIPMAEGVDSLNANVATAIFLYQLSSVWRR